MRLLSLARDLTRRKAREKHALFVVEGVRAVEELARSSLDVTGALVAPQLMDAPRGAALVETLSARGVQVEHVSAKDFSSAAATDSPQGVLAVAAVPRRTLDDIKLDAGPLLILDGVQDPGNVGTIVRTAAALGACATIALPGTVDLWNAKVVRSAVGAHFAHPAFDAPWQEVAAFLARTATPLWVTDANAPSVRDAPRVPRVAIALGNEGAGVSADVAAAAERRVGVPIGSATESLNVAVAAGILLYALHAT